MGDVSWLERLGERAGPFADAAARLDEAPPRGPDGVRFLSARIDGFLDDAQADEGAFLGAGGALLACLLVDALGGAHHRTKEGHRVRLGSHALVDPFAILDRAIDAGLEGDDPAAVLADALREAEADARDAGPTARAHAALAGALATRPERRVREALGWTARLDDGTELELGRLAPVTDDPAALAKAARALVALLPGGERVHVPWPEAAPRLRPRLVGAAFVAELGERARNLALRPLGHGAEVALQLAYEGRARFVRRDELAAWSAETAAERIPRRALANLAARPPTWVREGPLLTTRTGDGLDGSRLLLPGLGAQLAEALGPGPHLVAAPHRDLLLAGPATEAARLEALAADAYARAPHGISPGLFALDAGVLTPR